jgi:proton-dependent oligopeptide transporter, POT family
MMRLTILQKQPKGLYVLFLTEMWERFSFYGMRAILFLYLTKAYTEGALGLDEQVGGAVYGLYTSSVYLLTLPGGWIADNILGQKKAIWYGGIVIMLGHIVLAIPGVPTVFYLGLMLVAIGTGLLKPNISSIVGDLYPEGGASRDAGFSIFYVGINLGAFLGMFIVGYLGQKIGWHVGFGAAAFAMLLGLINFKVNGHHLKDLGDEPATKSQPTYILMALGIIPLVGLLVSMGFIDIVDLAHSMKYVIISLTVLYFCYIVFLDSSIEAADKKRVAVLFIFFIAAALFWSGFEQAGSTLTIFADRHTNLDFFGWQIPSSWFQNANSFYILIFSVPIGAIWIYLSQRKANPSIPVKFGLGLIQMGFGFLIMYFAAQEVLSSGGKVSMLWLGFTYMFHTTGELCLSPVGLSSYTKLAPRKYYSQLMGLWFVGAALGNLIAGLFAGNFDESNVAQMPALFMQVCVFGVGLGVLMLIFYKPIKQWMGGVE